MINKIIIGTANFIKGYGVLSNHQSISKSEIANISKILIREIVCTFDTALSYGDVLSILPREIVAKAKIICKFSVQDNFDEVYSQFRKKLEIYDLKNYVGILVHDIDVLDLGKKNELREFIKLLKEEKISEKVGVSVYTEDDVSRFNQIMTPEIIQVPLSPINQTFNTKKFINFVKKHSIEVHARSLFFQGLLFLESLPDDLNHLKQPWEKYVTLANKYDISKIELLLAWANSFKWIDHWVLGIFSARDLQEIIQSAAKAKDNYIPNAFITLEQESCTLLGSKDWKVL